MKWHDAILILAAMFLVATVLYCLTGNLGKRTRPTEPPTDQTYYGIRDTNTDHLPFVTGGGK